MSQRIAELRAEIAELTELIAELPAGSRSLVRQEIKLAALEAELATLEAGAAPEKSGPTLHADQSGQSGGVSAGAGNTFGDQTQLGDAVAGNKAEQRVGSLQVGRDAFVATQQTIHCYFGARPPEDAADLLSDYLAKFAEECDHLRLQRIAGQRQTGGEQAAVPELRLQAVYTSLTTDGPPIPRLRTRTTAGRVRRFLEHLEKAGRSPDDVAPERVISVAFESPEGKGRADIPGERMLRNVIAHMGLENVADDTQLTIELQRPELAVEAIAQQHRLVLLGEPGSGKSTVLRYLGHLLAHRACGPQVPLQGWADHDTPVPILVPLAQVAERLDKAPDPDQALWQTLGSILDGPQGLSAGLLDSLRAALRRGGVVLLCDGLDELSAEGGEQSPRTMVSQALQRLVARTKARIVVTSRVLPYQSASSWQLPADEGWRLRTLTPLAFGQVRTFARAWFRGLAYLDPDLSLQAARQTADDLIAQLEARQALAPLVRSPLLLTMLTLLHDNGRVPENEVALYEECVILLLERWEPVRQPGLKRKGLIERLGSPQGLTLARLRDPLHQLAYEAHRDARGEEGRGVIGDDLLQGRLVKFFDRLSLPDPLGAYKIFTRVLAEDAGLLVARGDDAFAFPHLSFQEYLAACFLAAQPTMRDLAYAAWQSDDRERWRKVLVLLAGRLAVQDKATDQGLLWLKRLWAAPGGAKAKAPGQYSQDVRLAALTYQGMGGRAAFAASDELDLEAEIEQPLRSALQKLFAAPDAAVPPDDRLIAGRLLGELGDPRFPVHDAEWQESLARLSHTLTGAGDHYWRYVPAGRYRIGGWNDEEPAAEHDLAAFWVARLPVTVAQFERFVAEGYRDDDHWTPKGLAWRGERDAPYRWGDPRYSGANQPVVNITWYEATAFCRWLSAQIRDALPAGYTLRLPTEAEWEAAAAYAGSAERREFPWGPDDPTPERAVYDAWKLNASAPFGLCPAGAAACGALDMAGNVLEWTSSSHGAYPEGGHTWMEDFKQSEQLTLEEMDVPLRGGAYLYESTSVRCAARVGGLPDYGLIELGFRVVVSPSPLAQTS